MINSYDKELNTFRRSFNNTPNAFPLSTDDFHSSNIATRQFWPLKPLRNPHWYFDSYASIKFVTWLLIIFSKVFEIIGKMRILFGKR